MSRGTLFYTVAIVIIILLGIALYFFSQRTEAQNVIQLSVPTETRSTTLSSVQTATYEPTIAFEKTAIAIFTQNPTLAISSTPYYVEIIYNEVARNIINGLTETPTPTILLNGTDATHKCSPVIENRSLGDLSTELSNSLKDSDIDAWVEVSSFGVYGFDESCSVPFQAVHSRFRVQIEVEAEYINDNHLSASIISNCIAVLAKYWGNMKDVSPIDSQLEIYLISNDNYVFMNSQYQLAAQAYTSGLRDESLVNSLGGINRN